MKEFAAGSGRIAAFFDLDGTMMAAPSLERNYFQQLRMRGKIAAGNYLRWLWEAVRLAPRGIGQMRHANKTYLRGVARDFQMPARQFLRGALDQAAWHAQQGHAIVIVSGTLEALAKLLVERLEEELAQRGFASVVRVCATRLEERGGMWTGRIIGAAMVAKAKADAVRTLAAELHLDLARCYAYGDTMNDRWMLSAVGRPAAVNASQELRRFARREGWAEISWGKEETPAQKRKTIPPRESEKRSARAEGVA